MRQKLYLAMGVVVTGLNRVTGNVWEGVILFFLILLKKGVLKSLHCRFTGCCLEKWKLFKYLCNVTEAQNLMF